MTGFSYLEGWFLERVLKGVTWRTLMTSVLRTDFFSRSRIRSRTRILLFFVPNIDEVSTSSFFWNKPNRYLKFLEYTQIRIFSKSATNYIFMIVYFLSFTKGRAICWASQKDTRLLKNCQSFPFLTHGKNHKSSSSSSLRDFSGGFKMSFVNFFFKTLGFSENMK